MLDPETLRDAFHELGTLAAERGKVIDIAVYGGAALMLASNFRIATQDVDAVADEDQGTIDEFAREIAARRQWPVDWLNDGVRTYLSPNVDGLAQDHELFASYPDESAPGLRVFVPTPAYLLAMKLMAMRIDAAGGSQDLDDLVNLLAINRIESPAELVGFAATFYPEARVSGRLHLGLQALWQYYQKHKPKDDNAPTYLGRPGPSP